MPDERPSRSASELIDARIAELGDWRGETLARVRDLIKEADPEVIEEWKYRGVPVWSHDGMICTGESYRAHVKLTFAKGATLDDPAGLFNSSLEGKVRRAIDLHEGDELDEEAFRALVRAAVALNTARPSRRGTGVRIQDATEETAPVLLSGGNPQIAMGYGDAPVRAYIAAMPGWKSAAGRRLDAIVERAAPGVRKAVKWNSPFYGIEGLGWFLSFHVFTRYIKVTFLNGRSLDPMPPVESKDENARYFHIHEEDELDEAQLADWILQASRLPGWVTSDIEGV